MPRGIHNGYVKGEQHWSARLTEEKVRIIRQSPKTLTEIAHEYGVDLGTIWQVRRNRTWKHVEQR